MTAEKNPDAYTKMPNSEFLGEASRFHHAQQAPRKSEVRKTARSPCMMYSSPTTLVAMVQPFAPKISSTVTLIPSGLPGQKTRGMGWISAR